jgi:Epoxide hydrolase N terminus
MLGQRDLVRLRPLITSSALDRRAELASCTSFSLVGRLETITESMQPKTFTVELADEVSDDLRARLARTRWPEQLPASAGWANGVDRDYLPELILYWQGRFDWRTSAVGLGERFGATKNVGLVLAQHRPLVISPKAIPTCASLPQQIRALACRRMFEVRQPAREGSAARRAVSSFLLARRTFRPRRRETPGDTIDAEMMASSATALMTPSLLAQRNGRGRHPGRFAHEGDSQIPSGDSCSRASSEWDARD